MLWIRNDSSSRFTDILGTKCCTFDVLAFPLCLLFFQLGIAPHVQLMLDRVISMCFLPVYQYNHVDPSF